MKLMESLGCLVAITEWIFFKAVKAVKAVEAVEAVEAYCEAGLL